MSEQPANKRIKIETDSGNVEFCDVLYNPLTENDFYESDEEEVKKDLKQPISELKTELSDTDQLSISSSEEPNESGIRIKSHEHESDNIYKIIDRKKLPHYSCQICGCLFLDRTSFTTHKRSMHVNTKSTKADDYDKCNEFTKNNMEAYIVQYNKIGKTAKAKSQQPHVLYKCKICGTKDISVGPKKHARKHFKKEGRKCEICGLYFNGTKQALRIHMKNYHAHSIEKGKSYSNSHQRNTDDATTKNNTADCIAKKEDSYEIVPLDKIQNMISRCEDCNNIFYNRHSFTHHRRDNVCASRDMNEMKIEDDPDDQKVQKIAKITKFMKENLEGYAVRYKSKSETDLDILYNCKKCKNKNIVSWQVRFHAEMHFRDKGIQCPEKDCGLLFSSRSLVLSHRKKYHNYVVPARTVSKEWARKKELALLRDDGVPKKKADRAEINQWIEENFSLVIDETSKTGHKIYKCKICGPEFSHIPSVTRWLHAQCHLNKSESQCPECHLYFTTNYHLQNHRHQFHGVEKCRSNYKRSLESKFKELSQQELDEWKPRVLKKIELDSVAQKCQLSQYSLLLPANKCSTKGSRQSRRTRKCDICGFESREDIINHITCHFPNFHQKESDKKYNSKCEICGIEFGGIGNAARLNRHKKLVHFEKDGVCG